MTARYALFVLLAAVSAAAAVLSFAALRDLALLCGFSTRLAWLLPVVVDAGAAAGSLVWLGRHGDDRAQRFARRLALVLLASSVAANAVSHGLEAYQARPAWWVVVLVSAVAPAVLGAVVHLAVLVGRTAAPPAVSSPTVEDVERPGDGQEESDADGEDVRFDEQEDDLEDLGETWEQKRDRLLGEGAGRPQLSRELDVTDWEARKLVEGWKRRQENEEASA